MVHIYVLQYVPCLIRMMPFNNVIMFEPLIYQTSLSAKPWNRLRELLACIPSVGFAWFSQMSYYLALACTYTCSEWSQHRARFIDRTQCHLVSPVRWWTREPSACSWLRHCISNVSSQVTSHLAPSCSYFPVDFHFLVSTFIHLKSFAIPRVFGLTVTPIGGVWRAVYKEQPKPGLLHLVI
jgi:hypothetical protein